MTLQDKLGIIYAFAHCGDRLCNNCMAREYCDEAAKRDSLWEEVIDEIAALTKEIDKAKEEVK